MSYKIIMRFNILDIITSLIKPIHYCLLIFISFCKKVNVKRKIDNKQKRIMILIGKISKGGAERAAVNLAEKLSKNYEVVIVTYANGNKHMKNVEDYKCTTKHISIEKEGFDRIHYIRQFKKENSITHCISFGIFSNFLNSITRESDKVIISVVNFLSVAEMNIRSKIKHKIATKLSDYIVAVSKQVEYDQIKNYNVNPSKICTISTYCNKKDIANAIKKYSVDEEDEKIFDNSRVIITVGKAKKQKGQWHLIRAFKKVVEEHKNAKLIILGTGELEEYLKKLIIELGLEKKVYFLGHKNKNIYTYMKKSDIFVLPSLFEGMPNVLLEAMECGLPIIATDCYGGNKEIIAPDKKMEDEVKDIEKCKYGILIPKLDFKYYNPEESLTQEETIMANAINEILRSNQLFEHYKEKSLQRIKEYNSDSYIETWKEILS